MIEREICVRFTLGGLNCTVRIMIIRKEEKEDAEAPAKCWSLPVCIDLLWLEVKAPSTYIFQLPTFLRPKNRSAVGLNAAQKKP